jgi:hypothetical protein
VERAGAEMVVMIDDPGGESLRGKRPETWLCVDCGVNTAPGMLTREELEAALDEHGEAEQRLTATSEVYMVTDEVWRATGLDGMAGCLCIGCLERRIGRRLKPRDFTDHEFNEPHLPATLRLRERRGLQKRRGRRGAA